MKVVSPKSPSDLELSKRFEMLFKQHFKPLCFYAMSFLSDEEVAKDIVHDVFYRFGNGARKSISPVLSTLIF